MSNFHFFYGGPFSYGAPFSQWFGSTFFDEAGNKYVTAEQYMMAKKALLFNDDEVYNAIMNTNNPSEQKALGRQVRNFDVDTWNKVARDIVFSGNLMKFSQNESLRKYMLDTKDTIIVEASPTDRIWGIGLGMNDPLRHNPQHWDGTNWLGECLMRVRKKLAGVYL